MEINGIKGNLLDSQAGLIMHQVNCQGVMNSGVAKAIRDKWPVVYEKYRSGYDKLIKGGYEGKDLLGKVLPVKVSDTQIVINLYCQNNFGYDGKRYTSYDALWDALEKTAAYCMDKGIKTVALPYNMSCHRGGGNWNVVLAMVKAAFKDTDINIEVWKLEE